MRSYENNSQGSLYCTMHTALPFFPLCSLSHLNSCLPLFAPPYTTPASPYFTLASPLVAAVLCAPAFPIALLLSSWLLFPDVIFPPHSILAHEAICILCNLSVPHQRSAYLIISMPLYLLEYRSSLHHSSSLRSPILPLSPPSQPHTDFLIHSMLPHHEAVTWHWTSLFTASERLHELPNRCPGQTPIYPFLQPWAMSLYPYHSLIVMSQHHRSPLPLHVSMPGLAYRPVAYDVTSSAHQLCIAAGDPTMLSWLSSE